MQLYFGVGKQKVPNFSGKLSVWDMDQLCKIERETTYISAKNFSTSKPKKGTCTYMKWVSKPKKQF